MTEVLFHRHMIDPTATAQFAQAMATVIAPGDCFLLEGNIGAGKTFFARCLIQSLLCTPEDVPSPTFTLVQTYDTQKGPVHHTDLYRLSSSDELIELGLLDALETDICLIEWPDRLGGDAPKTALTLSFSRGSQPDARSINISGKSAHWGDRLTGLLND